MLVYKISTIEEWKTAQGSGVFAGTVLDTLDGFIHLSTAEQVPVTLERHFADATELMLLAIDADGLDGLKWEKSRDGGLFPHLYGVLPMAKLLWAKPIDRDESGVFQLPLRK